MKYLFLFMYLANSSAMAFNGMSSVNHPRVIIDDKELYNYGYTPQPSYGNAT